MENRRQSPLRSTLAVFILVVGLISVAAADDKNRGRLIEKEGRIIMNAKEIIGIMDQLLRKEFSRYEAEKLFGTVADDSNPNVLALKSKLPQAERISLQMVEISGQKHLAGIHIKFRASFGINLQDLIGAYGSFRVMPRLKPGQPVPHAFDVNGKDYKGILRLGLEAGEGSSRKIREIVFARNLDSMNKLHAK
jgi:hypothetical protein